MMQLFDAMKQLSMGSIADIPEQMTWPLTRWCSNELIPEMVVLNRNYFNTTNKQKLQWLSKIAPLKIPKYPKGIKEDEKTKTLKSLSCQYFRWSMRECNKQYHLLQEDDIGVMADALGVDNKTRKLLGLQSIKLTQKTTPIKKKPEVSLLNF